MTGWVKIHRDIQNHWIFKDPFYRWWNIILFQANHKENKITLGYNIYKINIGQCANSLRTWAKLFNCSTKQVDKFFKMLESDNMIIREIIGKGKQSTTLINISNYTTYQHYEETQGRRKGDARETQGTTQGRRKVHTTKEYNNYKNNRIEEVTIIFDNILLSEIDISDVAEKFIDYFKISLKFYELFIKNLKEKNTPTKKLEKATYKNFVNPIRLMFEQDGINKIQLIKIYDFLNSEKGDFWKKHILSTSSLRSKFEKLSIQANSKENFKHKQKSATTYNRADAIRRLQEKQSV